jgi:hypothetical protein
MKMSLATGTPTLDPMRTTTARNLTLTLSSVLALLAGCTQDRTLAETTVTRLGANGGTATSPDGLLALNIPASALERDTDVIIEVDRSTLDGTNASPIYRVGPAGLTFAQDAKLTVRVRGSLGEDEVDVADLGQGSALLDALFDDATGTLSTSVRRASSYVARRRPNRCAGQACGTDCTTGNIARACNAAGRCVPTFFELGCGMSPDAGITDPDASVSGEDGGSFDPDGGPFDFDGGPFDPDGSVGGPMLEIEPNDDSNNANLLAGEFATVEGALSASDIIDWYAVDTFGDTLLTAYTYTSLGNPAICMGIDTVIEIYDSSLQLLTQNDDGNGTMCSYISNLQVGAGRYFVVVRSFAPRTLAATYYLDVLQVLVPGGGDGGVVVPPGDGGVVVPPGDGGVIVPPGDGGVIVPPGDGGTTNPPTDGGVIVPPGDGGVVAPPGDGGVIVPPGDGGVIVPPGDGGTTNPPGDGGVSGPPSEVEPNDSIASANAVGAGSTTQGSLSGPDLDYYTIVVPAAGTLTAYTYGALGSPATCVPGLDTVLEVYAPGAAQPFASNDDGPGRGFCSFLSVPVQPGQYAVRVRAFNRPASPVTYFLDVQFQ